VLVHLQHAGGPHVVDSVFDHVVQGTGFLGTVAEDEHLAGIHDGADTHSEGLLRHLSFVVVEETAVGLDGIGGEGLNTRSGGEAAAWLVEGNMSVRTYATHEEVYTTGILDHLLVVCTLCHKVLGIAIEDMDVLWLDVDMVEEVVPHKAVVALGMVDIEANILVHVEGDDVLERQHTAFVELRKVLVKSQWRTTGRASEDKRTLLRGVKVDDSLGHIIRSPNRHLVVIFCNNYSHMIDFNL